MTDNLYHPFPGPPLTVREFIRQHLAVCDDAQVDRVLKAFDAHGVTPKVFLLIAAYLVEPKSFGPFREYRNKVWAMNVTSKPDVDKAVSEAIGWRPEGLCPPKGRDDW